MLARALPAKKSRRHLFDHKALRGWMRCHATILYWSLHLDVLLFIQSDPAFVTPLLLSALHMFVCRAALLSVINAIFEWVKTRLAFWPKVSSQKVRCTASPCFQQGKISGMLHKLCLRTDVGKQLLWRYKDFPRCSQTCSFIVVIKK